MAAGQAPLHELVHEGGVQLRHRHHVGVVQVRGVGRGTEERDAGPGGARLSLRGARHGPISSSKGCVADSSKGIATVPRSPTIRTWLTLPHVDRHHRRPPGPRRDRRRTSSPSATPAARPARCSRPPTEPLPDVLGRPRRPRLARACTSPRSTAAPATGSRSSSSWSRSSAGPIAPGPFVPDRDRQRRARRRRRRRHQGAAACPASPTARRIGAVALGGVGHRHRRHGVRRRRRRARRRAGRRAARRRPATTSPSSRSATASRSRRRRTSTRPAARARVTLDGAPATVLPGARQVARRPRPRASSSAEAVGVARECTEHGRRLRQGARAVRPRRSPCTRRSSTTAPTWSWPPSWRPAPCGTRPGPRRPAATSSPTPPRSPPRWPRPAADLCANLNTQVHGGIAITWEHDAHLYMRRATDAARAASTPTQAAADLADLTRRGVVRGQGRRAAARGRADPRRGAGVRRARSRTCPPSEQRAKLIETGYVMPHWPKPYGRDAGAVEQLVIEQEFAAAGVKRPALRHHRLDHPHAHPVRHRGPGRPLGAPGARPGRHLVPAVQRARRRLRRRRRQDEGHPGRRRLARQRPEGVDQRRPRRRHGLRHRAHQPRRAQARRHHDDGRSTCTPRASRCGRCKMTTGDSEFNEVFFNDVFVPDDDVVGPVDGGWTVARATLGNESVSIGGGEGGMSMPGAMLDRAVRRPPRAARRRRRPRRSLHRRPPGDGPAQPAQRQPRRRRRRARARGRHHQARAVRDRPRGGRDPHRAQRPGRRLHGRRRRR